MGAVMQANEQDRAPGVPDDDASNGKDASGTFMPAVSSLAVPPDTFDSPWKDAIAQAFPEFLAFYFPAAHRGIDWTRGHMFLDTELRGILREADAGVRHADQLVQVHRKRGGPGWVYVHVEVQATRKADFERRMFTYSYRLFERFGRPVASLVVLADPHRRWRPDGYGFELFGSRHWLSFPTVKLLDYKADIDSLLANPNPFALVTAAHLLTRQTRNQPRQRLAAKWKLVRLLYERDWSKERVIGLFKVLDWMMSLPDALEGRLWQDIEAFEGKRNMPYITSVERIGMRKGFERGREQLLLDQLTHRFGPLSEAAVARVESATAADIDRWARRVLDASSLDEVLSDDA